MAEARRAPRLRILFFTSALGGGGAEKHLVRVVNGLDRSRFIPTVAVARGGGTYEAELNRDVAVVDLRSRRVRNAVLPLRRLVQESEPDAVCSVMDRANCVALAATRCLPFPPPVMSCVQIPPSIDAGGLRSVRRWLLHTAMSRLYPSAERIIALSEGVRQDLLTLVPTVADRVVVIHNAGLDQEVLRLVAERARAPEHGNARVIVACGRYTEQKGFDVLLEAFALLVQSEDAVLWLVGEGELRSPLEARARQLGVADRVWFAGFRPNPYSLMAAADVFVLSSRWEGFGNVIVEAMAAGTAVVATDCPYGPAEIIDHEENGILVTPGQAEALMDGIRRVLRDDGLRSKLARNGRNRAKLFSVDRIAAEYGAVLEQVAGRRPTGPAATA